MYVKQTKEKKEYLQMLKLLSVDNLKFKKKQ